MNKNKNNIPVSGVMNELSRSKSLSPAVLGVSNYHGLKLPSYMTSEAKQKLSTILEERRKARVEKLAASILAKGKQLERGKTSLPVLKPGLNGPSINSKGNELPVFDRFKTGKPKQSEMNAFKSQIPKTRTSSIPLKKQIDDSDLKMKPLNETIEIGLVENEEDKENLDPKNQTTSNSEPVEMEGEREIQNETEKCDATEENFTVGVEVHCETTNTDSFEDKSGEKALTKNVKTWQIEPVEMERERETQSKTKKCDVTEENCTVAVEVHCKTANAHRFQNKSGEKALPKDVKTWQIKPLSKTEPGNKKNPLRRSLSMIYREKRRTEFLVRRSISAKNLHEMSSSRRRTDFQRPNNVEKTLKSDNKSVTFLTPRNKKPLTSTHLRTKLEDWLKNNGHSLDGYRHLRCFDVGDLEKTALQCSVILSEDSPKPTTPRTPGSESDKENATPPSTPPQMDVTKAENWLKELHRLIVELKYPSERCEEWLAAIRKRCGSCTQLPIYWECLAALHESKGELKSAIEDYERAIIKGGEVDEVGNSLAQLFDKMVIEQKKCPKRKLEKGLDPKNIFKSTIIKFALQQKALKKLSSEMEPGLCQQLYVATPVRRSTRIQTPYKSTEEVSSLQTLTPELLKTVTFKPNQSLLGED